MGRGTSRFEYRWITINYTFARIIEANENILTMHYHN